MRTPRLRASALFFSVASVYAALVVPLAMYAMTAGADWVPVLTAWGHAHEMLFGFALLLVTAYLLNSVSRMMVAGLLLLWTAARLSYVLAPGGFAAVILSPLYALVLAALVVPKFTSAKKWRNRSIMPLLLLICLLPGVYAAAVIMQWPMTRYDTLVAGVLLLSLLMAFMGGRIIAPAAAGAFYRIGINLRQRVQPRLEATIIILLAVAAMAVFLPGSRYPAGIPACAAGTVLALRLWRWRLWQLTGRTDLWCLGIGYGWLALGLVLLGVQMLTHMPLRSALHVITVGALGTLSICIMTRVHLQQLRQDPAKDYRVLLAVVLIAISTVTRFLASQAGNTVEIFLWLATISWSLAYFLTAASLLASSRLFTTHNAGR